MKKIISIMIVWSMLLTIATFSVSATEERPTVPNEVVASVSSQEQAEQVADYYGITLQSYAYGVAVYTTPDVESVVSQRQTYSTMPTLCKNYIYTIDDPIIDYETQSEIQSIDIADPTLQYHHALLQTTNAWDITTGAGVTVAIIDTGVDIDHPALTHAISDANAYNSHTGDTGLAAVDDDLGHGTHVAGIVAAYSESDNVYGVAPDVNLLIIKANDPEDTDSFTYASLITAINYAVGREVDIINMSLGGTSSNDAEEAAIAAAVAAGITVICAAGNDYGGSVNYPAAHDGVIAVSAVNASMEFADYSNCGAEIDIAGYGSAIYSCYYDDIYSDYYKDYLPYVAASGTSMACPVVAGVAALILSANRDYTSTDIYKALCNTATDAGDAGKDDYYGNGIVNAYSAVLDTDNLYIATDENADTTTVFVAVDTSMNSEQRILALYENGQMKAVTVESGTTTAISATCQGTADEAKVFAVDGNGFPVSEPITYNLNGGT